MNSPNLPTSLLLNGREFSYADIAQYPAQLAAPVNGYEARLLDFFRQWQNGVQEVGPAHQRQHGQPQRMMLRRGSWKPRPAAPATISTWAPATGRWCA